MLAFALLFIFIPNILSNSFHISKFLNLLQFEEKINLNYIIQIGDPFFIDEIVRSLSLPKVSLKEGSNVNYLDFPRYKKTTSLKYYFNYEFLTIIFADFMENVLKSHLFAHTVSYSRNNIIVIITLTFSNNSDYVLKHLHKNRFANVIYIDCKSFELSKKFKTYNIFKNYELTEKHTFKNEDISNLNLHKVIVFCSKRHPFSLCFQDNNNDTVAVGIMFHTAKNFVKYINGTMDLHIEINTNQEYSSKELIFDIVTKIFLMDIASRKLEFPLSSETLSNPLDTNDVLLIVPKASYIKRSLYITKPFPLVIWLYIIYGTLIFKITFYITKKDNEIWTIFNQLLRSLLSQTYSNPIPGFKFTIFYLLAMILGFITTIWYSTLLGSYITTYLREPQISTISELKRSNIKITSLGYGLELTTGFEEIKDFFTILTNEELVQALRTANQSYGHLISSRMLEFSRILEQFSIIKDFKLESSFIQFYWKLTTIFKLRFNRYIGIIQDSGLYLHWKSNFFYESFKYPNSVSSQILYGKRKLLEKKITEGF